MHRNEFELPQIKTIDNAKGMQDLKPTVRNNVNRLLGQDRGMGDISGIDQDKRCAFYIDPDSVWVLLWNLLFMVVFYFIQLQISMALAFGVQFFEDELQIGDIVLPLYIAMLGLLAFDMHLNLFKGYYAFGRGRVIDEHSLILQHYLKGQFIIDALVLLLLILPFIYQSEGFNFIQLLPAGLLWVKKFKYQGQISQWLQYSPWTKISFILVVLFSDVLMIGNYGACIFIGMDIALYNAQYYGQNTAYYWLTNNASYPISLLPNGLWYYQYIYGVQFATGTLSTMAPGPFAKNPWEAFYAIIVMVFFMVLASYVGEVLIQIVYTFTERRTFHEENIISFDNFMKLKEVARPIRNRIYNFFQLVWEVELKMEGKEQQTMIEKMPPYLREELLLQIGCAKKIDFLGRLPKTAILQKMVALKLQSVTIDAGTTLTQPGRKVVHSIYYIKEGMAKFCLRGREGDGLKQRIVALSNAENMIGVYEFITGQDYYLSCHSIDLCLVQQLSRTLFDSIIAELNLWQEFKQLQYRVLIERQMNLIGKNCVVCWKQHMETDCPDLHYHIIVTQATVHKQSYSKNHTRQKFVRKNLRSHRELTRARQKELDTESIFKMFSGLNLGKLIVDIQRIEGQGELEIDEVQHYNSYYPTLNAAHPLS